MPAPSGDVWNWPAPRPPPTSAVSLGRSTVALTWYLPCGKNTTPPQECEALMAQRIAGPARVRRFGGGFQAAFLLPWPTGRS